MRCPKCQAEDIEVSTHSVPFGTSEVNLRHHHGKCRQCHEILWWNTPPGSGEPTANIGTHECGFFRSDAP